MASSSGRATGPEILVRERAAQEDAVLHAEGRDLASADAEECQLGGGDVWLLEAEAAGQVGRRDREVRREGEAFPGRRPDGVAEDPVVRALGQPVATGGLFVSDARRQIRSRLDLVVDDGSIADGWTDDGASSLAQGLDQGIQIGARQEPLPGHGGRARDRVGDHGSRNLPVANDNQVRRRPSAGEQIQEL